MNSNAEIKSLEDIISLMDGHTMKGYQSKLPKKPSINDSMSQELEAPAQSPGDMAEAAQGVSGESEMDDAAMQELMKMYESDEEWPKSMPPQEVTGVN